MSNTWLWFMTSICWFISLIALSYYAYQEGRSVERDKWIGVMLDLMQKTVEGYVNEDEKDG